MTGGRINEVAWGELRENGQVGLFAGTEVFAISAVALMCGSIGSGENDQNYQSQQA
jgi:hypothetical protein